MNRKLIAIVVLGLVLFACLLACGYFGAKAIRRTRLRRAAMTAYEKKEYVLAERLLLQYVARDPNAEAEFVALANVYHEFGNAGMEAQMWQTASSLNPLNPEYRENMLTSAEKSASYPLLHSILGQKTKVGEEFTDQELYLYVISSYRSGHQKDGSDAYKKALEADPEAFHKSELGRMAEFMVNYSKLSEGERNDYLNRVLQSEDPVIRFEALYTAIRRAAQQGDENECEEKLKQAMETNYFAGTPLLADFYYSKYRFEDVISILKPYLKTIDDISMYLLYAESCVFTDDLDEVKALEKKLRRKFGALLLMADYCEILIAHLENDEEKLAAAVRKSGKLADSPLSRFLRLRVAMASESFNEIRTVAQEIFSAPPFHDLHNRALLVCLDYLSEQMKKQENQDDPSRMAELAKILAGYLQGDRLLTEIILSAQYKKGLAAEAELLAAVEQFPDDPLLVQITAEYLIFNDKPEQALALIEQVQDEDGNSKLDFLYMLALDQTGRHEEAAEIFHRLVEQSEFDLDLLVNYFNFCREYERSADLLSMYEKLKNAEDAGLVFYADFFRAAALLLENDEAKKQEALKLLAMTPNDAPDFTFYAANRLFEADMLTEAEAKYLALMNTYSIPCLIYANLSELYSERGENEKALEAAKKAFDMEKTSMLPAFIYATRLSEAERYEDAVNALSFPRHAVNYREDVVELWVDCMRHVIEKSMAEERFRQAEEQCKHLLVIAPDDEFGRETLEKVREILKPKKDEPQDADAEAAPAA